APRDGREELRHIPVELLTVNPHQPRRTFDDEALLTLAESIRALGVIQPVLVRPVPGGRYELIAGERRWRAAQLADLDMIPAVVRETADAATLELAVIENMAREDLTPVEEARACAALVEELGLTREEVGLRVGRSRVAVSNLIRLLELPDEALELLDRRELSEGHGRALLLTGDNSLRRSLARQAASQGWSVRELEARARAAQGERAAAHHGGSPDVAGQSNDADRQAAVEQITDMLGAALGAEVDVRAGVGGFTIRLRVASVEEALALAERISG
ncbi:MAG: ParB/RepB/Spo0J family partition protein, partial [Actinomycetota bacterium]|nr:ParB/RepB/Spo0J family partition protein [Actinomycetota bacterium]